MTRLSRRWRKLLVSCYGSEGFLYNSENRKTKIKHLEDKKGQILLNKEKKWRLKIRAI